MVERIKGLTIEKTGWIKAILYLGLTYLTGVMIVLLLIAIGLKEPVKLELPVLTGLVFFTIILGGSSTLYYILSDRFTEKQEAQNLVKARYTGLIGSALILFSSLYILYLHVFLDSNPLYYYFVNTLIYIGFILAIYSLSAWLSLTGEKEASSTVKMGIFFPLSSLIAYLASIFLYETSLGNNVSVYVFGVETLVSGIVFSLLVMLIGLEILLSHRESYLLGSTYTVAALMVVLFIVQMLTTITTTSILAEKISSYQNTTLPLTIQSGDKVGLLIVSYKIYLLLIMLFSILYLASLVILMKRKTESIE